MLTAGPGINEIRRSTPRLAEETRYRDPLARKLSESVAVNCRKVPRGLRIIRLLGQSGVRRRTERSREMHRLSGSISASN